MKKNKILNLISTFLFYIFIILFFIGFNFQDSGNGGWIRQYITANIGIAQFKDMAFTDSLTGYIITSGDSLGNGYILRTINGGFNWNIIRTDNHWFTNIFPLNKDTIFFTPLFSILKTTNAGTNWSTINFPGSNVAVGFYALNSDTMWFADNIAPYLGGGLYRTTNGGINWQLQFTNISGVSGYAQSIYMYNRNIGFMGTDNGELLKTTNSGVNWVKVYTSVYADILDICFKDSLVCFLADYELRKTTNGGLNWQSITLPNIPGTYHTDKTTYKLSYNSDTIYTVGSSIEYSNPWRYYAVIYKSTNGGLNWGYQIPDTSFHIPNLQLVSIINGKTGWVYNYDKNYGGLHTTIGGDTTIYVGINNIITILPKDYVLYQNYPNPFNPVTTIKYKIEKTSTVKIIVFDISGKEIKTFVNKKQSKGSYEVRFDGNSLSSGVYFYALFADGVRLDTKKLILLK